MLGKCPARSELINTSNIQLKESRVSASSKSYRTALLIDCN